MSDFSVRSDNVDVEQIMRQIRARIREKRGVDYTEEEIRELANVKLEKFLDPKGVRSDLLQQYRQAREATLPPNYKFEDTTLFETHRGLLAFIRKLLRPVLKLFFNPNPLIEALHIQSKLNDAHAAIEPLHYEIIHNLVLELTRTSIEVKNLKMRIESMSSRLDFDERRARALEGVVEYRPGAVPPLQPPTGQSTAAQPGQHNELDNEGNERRARRRRRRGRRRSGAGADESPGRYGATGHAPEGSHGRYAGPRTSAPGDRPDSRDEETGPFSTEGPSDAEEGADSNVQGSSVAQFQHEGADESDRSRRNHIATRDSGDPTFPAVPERGPAVSSEAERSDRAPSETFAPAERRELERRPDATRPADSSSDS